MTNEEYIRSELRKGRFTGEYHTSVKATGPAGESRWTKIPDYVFDPMVAVASATDDEIASLIYALSCLTEDPGYLSSPRTQRNLENLYARMTGCDTEGDN